LIQRLHTSVPRPSKFTTFEPGEPNFHVPLPPLAAALADLGGQPNGWNERKESKLIGANWQTRSLPTIPAA
jgi:hypothetical protein